MEIFAAFGAEGDVFDDGIEGIGADATLVSWGRGFAIFLETVSEAS